MNGGGQEWTVICNGALGELKAAAAKLGASVVDEGVPSLDEIFVARVGAKSLNQ
jgi:ABC-2 type transport system ATP-binding protein